MDWKYAHYRDLEVFPEGIDAVAMGARRYMAETHGWTVVDTADGFEASGHSFLRSAIARFRVVERDKGTAVTVDLQVERLSSWGYMLVDVGGYYAGQIRLWLSSIGASLAGGALTVDSQRRAGHARLFDKFVLVCALILLGAGILNFVVFPVIGLVTGVLYWIGRGSGGGILHGPWARAVSAATLLFDAFIAYRIRVFLGATADRNSKEARA